MKKIFSIIRYYTPAEYVLIILLGIASNLSLRYYPLLIDYPKIVEGFHEVLNLPGPGGGIFLPAGIYLFWAFILYGLTVKKGAIFFMTLIMLAVTAIQSPLFSGKNAFWNIGLIVLSISCEIFTVLFKDRKAPGRIMPAVLVALAAACVVQILLGVKIWAKTEMWPGAVPVFIAAGFIIAFIMLIKRNTSYCNSRHDGNHDIHCIPLAHYIFSALQTPRRLPVNYYYGLGFSSSVCSGGNRTGGIDKIDFGKK